MGGPWLARAACVLASIAFFACGEGRPPPNAALRPGGAGWFCWRNARIRGSSSCQRTRDACEASRAKAVGGKQGEAAATYSDCAAQPSAGCFTHKTKAGSETWYCAASYDDCESIARTLSRDPEHASEYDGISQCETW